MIQAGIAAAMLIIATIIGIEWHGRTRARSLRNQVATAEIDTVPGISVEMQPYRRWTIPLLRAGIVEAQANRDFRKQLNFSLAILPDDPVQLDWLKKYMLTAQPEDVATFRTILMFRPERNEVVEWFWNKVEEAAPPDESGSRSPPQPPSTATTVLPAAAILALCDRDNSRWHRLTGRVIQELLHAPSAERVQWVKLLIAVREAMIAACERTASNGDNSVNDRILAEDLLNSFRSQL
jgi:hypothetical protein